VLKAYRTPKGRRYYTEKPYSEYTGEQAQEAGKTIIYARVSSNNQKDDWNNQIEFLKQYANAKGIIVDKVLKDVGSGWNYNRKEWNLLIDKCVKGEIKCIIIAHKDRFLRFGFEWFERFLQSNGAKIIIVNKEKMSPEQEVVNDLISSIPVFSCRIYGLRKYKNKEYSRKVDR